MNWKREAVEMLMDYPERLHSLSELQRKIFVLNERQKGIRSPLPASTSSGGTKTVEDAWIDCIMEKDKLEEALKIVRFEISRVKRGLDTLDDDERFILDCFFINRKRLHVERVSETLHIESSQVYRKKDEALRKFTLAMFGMIEV